MKVGVLLKDQDPEGGGGYTFQNEILDAFLALHAKAVTSFVFSRGPGAWMPLCVNASAAPR